jgi:hypothetical protein
LFVIAKTKKGLVGVIDLGALATRLLCPVFMGIAVLLVTGIASFGFSLSFSLSASVFFYARSGIGGRQAGFERERETERREMRIERKGGETNEGKGGETSRMRKALFKLSRGIFRFPLSKSMNRWRKIIACTRAS